MNLKKYHFPVVSKSYVTFQRWEGGGYYRGNCGHCTDGSGWGSAFSVRPFNLAWTVNFKRRGASVPLLLMIFMVQHVLRG